LVCRSEHKVCSLFWDSNDAERHHRLKFLTTHYWSAI
jgi:hypothetical protein